MARSGNRPALWSFLRRPVYSFLFALTVLVALTNSLAWDPSSAGANLTPEPDGLTDWTVGTPWAGPAGVMETTDAIMGREKSSARPSQDDSQTPKAQAQRGDLPQNPDSPDQAQWPNQSPSAPTSAPTNPQTPGTSFTATTLAESGVFPPDAMGAVGPTQFLAAVRGRIKVFDKNSGAVGALNTSLDAFFDSVRNASGVKNPRLRFDRLAGRWFVLAINTTTPNRLLIAVSDNATITGATVWTFFFFQHDQAPPSGDAACLADYPSLGIDANALYIGVNQLCPNYSGTAAFVVRKASVLGAGPVVVTAFRNLTGTIGGPGPYAPQGVDNYSPAAAEGYFIGVNNAGFGTLMARRVSDPGGVPALSSNLSITVPTTSLPLTVRHQGNTGGTNGQLHASDDRLFAAHIRNGRLWTAHNIGVDNTGAAGGARTRNGSRWYELDGLNTATPTVVQAGTLFAATPSNTFDARNYWFPSVMVSGQGHMALGCSIAGTNEFINAATAGRLASDFLGTLQAVTPLTASATAYNPFGDPGTATGYRLWGEYSYTSLDPCDDMTMWTIQEFCNAGDSWGVRAVKLLAPPPATPATVNPSSVPVGQASVNVTVTGTQAAGSGFYDPGVGFACRIGATVSGVTVNSVTYNSPTSVTLNISTVGATAGAKSVTITNPDGQSVTTPALLTVGGISGCTLTINPGSKSFAANGGTGTITITGASGCDWNATSNAAFITINSGSSGSGNGTVNYTAAANASTGPRSGTIIVAGQTFIVFQGAAFNDVPEGHLFYTEIGKISARGVTLGCGGGNYCPEQAVTREQLAAFIMRARGEFNPPPPATQRFADVPPTNIFYNFIDRLGALGITQGCGGGNYCPAQPVLREQMAAFIIRALNEFNPPPPGSQRYQDVPPSNIFYNFIDRMAVLGITQGCQASPPLYCPQAQVTRAQMAAFLVRAFNL